MILVSVRATIGATTFSPDGDIDNDTLVAFQYNLEAAICDELDLADWEVSVDVTVLKDNSLFDVMSVDLGKTLIEIHDLDAEGVGNLKQHVSLTLSDASDEAWKDAWSDGLPSAY